MLIDSHAHLQHPFFSGSLATILGTAATTGIQAWLIPSVSDGCWSKQYDITQHHTNCFAAYGLHPLQASKPWRHSISLLDEYLMARGALAIGEVGLDHQLPDHCAQEALLTSQLSLARERDLPVILHNRGATDRLLHILQNMRWGQLRGLVHGFTGSLATAQQFLRLGLTLSLGPAILNPASHRVHAMVQNLPTGSFMFETDAPQLHIHKTEPLQQLLQLHRIVDQAATLRETPSSHMLQQATECTCRLFPTMVSCTMVSCLPDPP